MHFNIVQAERLGCIFARSKGRFAADHMQSLIATVSSLDFYQTQVKILHDMRLVGFDVPVATVHAVAQSRPLQPAHTKLALINDTELGYGMLRVIGSIRENVPRVVGVFRTVPEALDWLAIPGLSGELPEEIETLLNEGLADTDGLSYGLQLSRYGNPV